MDRVRDDRGVQRAAGRARGFSKQKNALKKERAERAFRGKVSKNKPTKEVLRGSARAQFVAMKARKRRTQLGLEGKSRRSRRLVRPNKSIALFNLKAAVLQFKRTGKLPFKSVDEIRMMDASGIDADSLRRMIQRMLVRSGVEENPGPKYAVPVPVVASQPKEKKHYDKEPACPSPASSSSSTSTSSRDDEKRARCGGNEPDERTRLSDKKSRGKLNFKNASLLAAAGMVESDKASGQRIADSEKTKENEDNADQAMHDAYVGARPAFVMRSGGFARPWYSGFGIPTTRPQLVVAMLSYLQVWVRYIRGLGVMPLWNPREGDVWKNSCPEDDEIATPVYKGFVMTVFLAGLMSVIFVTCFLFTWAFSLSSLVSWIGVFLDWFIKTTLFVQLFGCLFRPVLRYVPGDTLYEVGSPRFWDDDPHFDPNMRMPGLRFRNAIDRAVLADVPIHKVTVVDDSPWWQKHMAVSWLMGSLFSWLDLNRLITLQHTRAVYIVSIRLADMIACGLTRSRLESYWDAEGKARNLASTYDELKLGTQQVNGRNVREDTICYAAALYWSRLAADASLGNGGRPQSD
jgi:hypothetical protein